MKKRLIILIILVCIATFFIILRHEKKDNTKLTMYGNIEIRQVDLAFRVQGKVAKMIKEEGDEVKKGQLLAILDDVNYQAAYEKAVADESMKKSLSEEANQIYEKNILLCQDGTTSRQNCDTYLNSKNSTKAAYEASVAATKSANKDLKDTRIYAPDDGIIMTRVQEPGASVSSTQSVYTMAKMNPLWVRAYVSEENLGNIAYGMKAKVYTDSKDPKTGKKREYKGTIGYISPNAEFTPKTVQTTDLRTDLVYQVRVYIDNVDKFLRLGMPVTVDIDLLGEDGNGSRT